MKSIFLRNRKGSDEAWRALRSSLTIYHSYRKCFLQPVLAKFREIFRVLVTWSLSGRLWSKWHIRSSPPYESLCGLWDCSEWWRRMKTNVINYWKVFCAIFTELYLVWEGFVAMGADKRFLTSVQPWKDIKVLYNTSNKNLKINYRHTSCDS